VDNLTKSLAIEWADHGVRINSVAPVSTASSYFKAVLPFMFILHTSTLFSLNVNYERKQT